MRDLHTAIEKLGFSPSLPRYTSYPTAAELREITDRPMLMRGFSAALRSVNHLSLYVHIPFCPSLCYFCACNKIITRDEERKSSYLSNLDTEAILLQHSLEPRQQVVQLHLGGGSPSFLTLTQLTELLKTLDRFHFVDGVRKSIEIDPRTFTLENFELLYQHGFRRFSLGVQDFNPDVQDIINRIQPHELTVQTLDTIRSKSNTEINVDLIYGLPGQTLESFGETIDAVCALKPHRLAIYGYAHVKWKIKVQNVFEKHPLPSSIERQSLFECAREKLARAGYNHIGLDHFALPEDELVRAQLNGQLHRNFMGYSVDPGEAMVALGLSALSDVGDYIIQNSLEEQEYAAYLARETLPFHRVIQRSQEDKIRSCIIETLMCNCFLSLALLQTRFPNDNVDSIFSGGCEKLRGLEQLGIVEIRAREIHVPEQGRLFLRHIASAFDSYLHSALDSGRRFSNAV